MKKHYVFRRNGEDEGFVAELTNLEYVEIQRGIHELGEDDPFYIYRMESASFALLEAILLEYRKEQL